LAKSNQYKLTKGGHTYILTVATPKPDSTRDKILQVHLNQCVSLYLVRPVPPNHTHHPVPKAMTPLFQEYANVLQTPTSIPPSRHIDHSIHLIPGPALPNAPTHRLAPRETEVREKKLTDLITFDHLHSSSAPYATTKTLMIINAIFRNHLGSILVSYLGDIIIFS